MKKPFADFLKRLKYSLGLLLITVFCSVLMGCASGGSFFHLWANKPISPEKQSALALYHQAWKMVKENYVDPSCNAQEWSRWEYRYDDAIENKADSYEAIKTMLASLNDPYTRLLIPNKASEQNLEISSRLFGVGMHLTEKDNQVIVVTLVDDSPAAKAGIRPFDMVIKVNNENTTHLPIDDVVSRIRGPKGTQVSITVSRHGVQRTFKIQRDEIKIKSVFYKKLNRDIAYIRLTTFISVNATKEMSDALVKARKDSKALIVDIRSNFGGLFPNALKISDMFLTHGDIVSVVFRDGEKDAFTADSDLIYDKPVVLLVDGGSASASEIFGGALKDNHRATLIGDKTFGKGLVQKINPLPDGSALNMTISKYLTPNGTDINKKGIEPDIAVAVERIDYTKLDPQKPAHSKLIAGHLLKDTVLDTAKSYIEKKIHATHSQE